jgi:hypothetical protein
VVRGLRARGLVVVTALEGAGLGADDAEHLRAAASAGRVLVTQDTDFLRLASAGEPHAGIAYFQHDARIGDMIRWLLLLAEVMRPEEMANHVEFF